MNEWQRFFLQIPCSGLVVLGLSAEGQAAATGGLAKMQRNCLKLLQAVPGGPQYSVIISCSGTLSEWRADGAVEPTQSQNLVVAYVSLSTMAFSTPKEQVAQASESLECTNYTEWQGSVNDASVETSCSELLKMERLDLLCTHVIKERNMADPTSFIWEKTGRTFNPCHGGQ